MERETTPTITVMATFENAVTTISPEPGQLCTACVSLIPGEQTVPLHSKDWGTLRSLSVSAQSCSLCAIILSGRNNWLETIREYEEDIYVITVDARPLKLTLTRSQMHESGVSSNMLVISIWTELFSFPHYFFIMYGVRIRRYVVLMSDRRAGN